MLVWVTVSDSMARLWGLALRAPSTEGQFREFPSQGQHDGRDSAGPTAG